MRLLLLFLPVLMLGQTCVPTSTGGLRCTVTTPSTITIEPTTTPGIPVNVNDDLQILIDENPAGAVFLIKAGVHRLQSVTPKDNQRFTGEAGAVLNGARVISPVKEGAYWVATGQTQHNGPTPGECQPAFPACTLPEDLFLDSKPLQRVLSLSGVTVGKWYLDYAAAKLYMGTDPTGHTVEASVQPYAFGGTAKGVIIENLAIEKYASPAQYAAVNYEGNGAGWTIRGNDVRLCHGMGIRSSGGSQLLDNKIHDMGELGAGGGGDDVLVQGNEFYSNRIYAGYLAAWEGGANKFVATNRLRVLNNNSHDNEGTGFWTDIDNINTLYDSNTATNNTGAGISHEISYAAVIRNNVLKNNGPAACSWLWGAAVQIQNSQNVEVYGNTITVNSTGCGQAVVIYQQNRGTGKYGPYQATGNRIHDNAVTFLGTVGASGGVTDYPNPDIFAAAAGNVLSSNHYHVKSATGNYWAWSNSLRSWTSMRGLGQEANSTMDTVIP